MIRGVFFDAGNTLLFPDYDIYRGICAKLGVGVTHEQTVRAEAAARSAFDAAVASSPGAEVHGFWPVYYTPFYEILGVPQETIPDAIELTRNANDEGLGIWKIPAEELDWTLDELSRRDIVVGIISNSDGRLEWRLDQLGILARFEFVIDSAVVGASKPNPEIFRDALRRSSLRSDQTIYVGDYYEVDVIGARSAGILPVLLDPVMAYENVDCRVITRLRDLLPLVDVINEGGGAARRESAG
ncbi:MAG: HAD family hydrolase [Candidatus Eisenbacteria bacterium]|nr:HAD family hydrolase [Candidatus Eisenbacteria bacterium]